MYSELIRQAISDCDNDTLETLLSDVYQRYPRIEGARPWSVVAFLTNRGE
jgi:hypothetical protein